MLRSYIVVAIRNLRRQGFYSFINIFGLTAGVLSSLFLLLYIKDELSFDAFHKNADQIYRVGMHASIQDTKVDICQAMSPIGPTMKADFPEVENFVRINYPGRELVTKDDQQFYEEKFYFADSSFFNIFSFQLLKGDPKKALVEPNSIVLTESVAKKYFGDDEPIGKVIKTGSEEWQRIVTGVMKDAPANSHFQPRALVSYSTLPVQGPSAWGNINDWVYLQLAPGTDPKVLEGRSPAFMEKYTGELFRQFNAKADFYLEPLTSIHLYSKNEGQIEPAGDITYIYVFSIVAIFILLIASINYMNLATARGTMRAKEVGIRKVLGSYRKQLMIQFTVEAIVVTLLSVVLSVVLAFFLLPYFNDLADKTITRDFYKDPFILLALSGVLVFLGLVSGSYPAFYLSRFQSAQVLKGRASSKSGNPALRKALVVFQFSISIIMVICTWVVYDQLNFMKEKNLGFNKDQVIRIPLEGQEARKKLDVLKQALLTNPDIYSVGSGWATPGGDFNLNGIFVEMEQGGFTEKGFMSCQVDAGYLPTLEIEVVEGRNFSEGTKSDTSNAVIVNQELAREMGWTEPIGKRFKVMTGDGLQTREVKVVGVIKNFHQRALQEPIMPIIIHNSIQNGILLVRINTANTGDVLSFIDKTWKDIITNRPLQYSFLEQDFYEKYQADESKGQVFATFSIFTIVIACMGLFGLASYTAEQRKKEIGLRKVIGASVSSIMLLISKDFLKLVGVSILIAFPIAYYAMSNWLQEFEFRISPSPITFISSAGLILVVTLLTVGYHSLIAATGNPVASLKDQ
ncbi:ABC transporter permease [uncultured Imperialibacter sp.]|uniref:ABC transporter permease n=1 Tax=uncultured Imperialibacter sp. TaxID=1672639 RepID=UPI0030DB7684|tara:strand:- start:29315 stop:31708 length:2394 start_codon:yes stop_codon:yes gene_type:complete